MNLLKSKIVNVLRWSEKYTKTDMLYVAEGGFWLTTGQFLSTLISLLSAIAFANLLSQDTYGTYKYVIYLAGILSAFSLTGMNTSVAQAAARGFEGTLKRSFWIQLKWGLLVTFFAILGSAYYLINDNKILALAMLIIGISSPFLNSANTYISFLNGKKDFKNATKFSTISSIASIIAIITTLFITKNVVWLILTYFFINTITNLFFYFYTSKKILPQNDKVEEESISYGKHLSLMNIVVTISSFLDGILVFHFLGPVSLAVYSFAVAPVDQLKGLAKRISLLIMPKLANKSFGEIDNLLYKRISQLFILGFLISSVYMILSPYLFELFFPQYENSIRTSQLYSIIVATTIPAGLLGAKWQAKLTSTPKNILYRMQIVSSFTMITILIIFTPIWGIVGLVIGRIIHSLLYFLIDLFYWKKALRFVANQESK